MRVFSGAVSRSLLRRCVFRLVCGGFVFVLFFFFFGTVFVELFVERVETIFQRPGVWNIYV